MIIIRSSHCFIKKDIVIIVSVFVFVINKLNNNNIQKIVWLFWIVFFLWIMREEQNINNNTTGATNIWIVLIKYTETSIWIINDKVLSLIWDVKSNTCFQVREQCNGRTTIMWKPLQFMYDVTYKTNNVISIMTVIKCIMSI